MILVMKWKYFEEFFMLEIYQPISIGPSLILILVAMVFCLYGIFKSNLCLPRCFFAVFIFFGFLLLPSKLSGIVKPPLEIASTLQDHCLPQTTVTEPNFIQVIFSILSNLKISSSFHLEFQRGCQRYISPLVQAQA